MISTSTPAVLITGATGFIGAHVAEKFLQQGWRLKLFVRNAEKLKPLLKEEAEIITGDLNDLKAIESAIENVSIVVHCAANVKTWDSLENYYAVNVAGTKNLIQSIIKAKKPLSRFIHISTVDVYGFPTQPCTEDSPIIKSGFGYGDSKAEGESMVRRLCDDHAIPYVILRPCNVIGPHSQFIQRIGDALQSGPMLTIDTGSVNAGLVYIDNLTDKIFWAATNEHAVNECYNVRDYNLSWAEFLALFRNGLPERSWILDMRFGVADVLARIFETAYRIFLPKSEPLLHHLLVRIFGRTCGHSADKIRQARGPVEIIGLEVAMDKSIEWYLKKSH